MDLEGLETSRLELKFVVHKHHFRHGRITLKCTASIPKIYYQESYRNYTRIHHYAPKSIDQKRKANDFPNIITGKFLNVYRIASSLTRVKVSF